MTACMRRAEGLRRRSCRSRPQPRHATGCATRRHHPVGLHDLIRAVISGESAGAQRRPHNRRRHRRSSRVPPRQSGPRTSDVRATPSALPEEDLEQGSRGRRQIVPEPVVDPDPWPQAIWKRAGLGAAVASLLLMAACGGGSSSSSGSSSTPAASTAAPVVKTATATVGGKSETILTDAKGMTLYHYTPDKGGKVTCTGGCAAAWPPLLLPAGTTKATGTGLTGTLGTVPGATGGMQVTYNGWPPYGWIKDKAPGDTTGQGEGGNWFVVTPLRV
jgi:predicted lipoprotein with Yx(FWY)xxD motif